MTHDELRINVDGACRGNPGPSSVGVEIRDSKDKVIRTISRRIGVTTNNVAEYYALIYALIESIALKASRVHVFSDSQLMARQFSGEYKVKEPHIRLLFGQVRYLRERFDECTVTHVPREENTAADKLANQALDDGEELL